MNNIKVYLIINCYFFASKDYTSNIYRCIYLAPITAVSLPGFIIPLTESIDETLKLNRVE